VIECTRVEMLLEAELAGDIEDAEAAALRDHCVQCESCRSLLALHDDLMRLGAETEEPSERALDAVTAEVLARTARSRTVAGRATWRASAGRVAAALAACVLLFVAGWLGARRFQDAGRGAGDVAATPELVAALSAEAASNDGLSDVEDSRFTYSNVSIRDAGAGRLDLSFDVTTHVQLVEPPGSPLVREVLAQALLDRSSTGARLEALAHAERTPEPKVREAMILSLRADPSLAVRLKALELLSRHLDRPDVEAAVIDTLRDDESVQMRLEALEALAAHRVDHGRIRDVIEERARPGNEALRVRLASLPERS
jgi:hypothetical protein